MKKHIILVLFLMTAVGLGLGWYYLKNYIDQSNQAQHLDLLEKLETTGAENFEFTDIYGKNYELYDFKDKIVIINFWASWCDPCIKEFPSMINLLGEFPKDVMIIAFSMDYTRDDIDSFLKAFKVPEDQFVVVWDEDKTFSKSFKVEALPESYIIGKDQKLIRKIAGAEEWDTPDAILFFKSFLNKE